LFRRCLLWVHHGYMDIPAVGALGVSGFALGVRISSGFLVALRGYKSGKVSGDYLRG
jgi:hypothetical protein